MMIKILVIEDDELLAHTLTLELEDMGHHVKSGTTFSAGRTLANSWQPDLILLDIHLPDQEDLKALPEFCSDHPESFIVIMTGDPDNNVVLEAMSSGAFDFLRKPLDLDEIQSLVSRVVNCIEQQSRPVSINPCHRERKSTLKKIVGSSPEIIILLKKIGMLARTDIPVLLEGESGTGKELVARTLHNSSCPDEPFVAINCSAIVPTLLESELFGHEKGAFTGAEQTKVGKLQFAGRGTVFLDEIGDMPLELQGKILRVLQEEEFERVGGLQTIPLNARIIAATNRDLRYLIKKNRFRAELYYRLAVSKLEIPPLRKRRDDIPALINHCLDMVSQRLNSQPITLDGAAMNLLKNYSWPGNIRELENMLIRAASLANSTIITANDLEFPKDVSFPDSVDSGVIPLAEMEIRYIRNSLEANNWHITNTSRQLGISQTTLRKKISSNKLRPSRRRSDAAT